MNIVKMQEELKGVPDQALIGYVQNPGQVPAYLALGELQRRKQMRADAATHQQAPQQSVAEQMTAPPPQTQGVAGLPISNVGNEQAYKAGGIVAHFEAGGVTGLDSEWDRWMRAFGNAPTKNAPNFKSKSEDADTAAKLHAAVEQIPNEFAVNPADLPGGTNDPIRQKRTAEFLKKQAEEQLRGIRQPASKPAPVPTATPAAAPAGIVDLIKARQVNFNPDAYNVPEAHTMESERDRYMQSIGEDPMRASLQERLAKMDETAASDAEKAPWMAVMKAGLATMSGKSPFALQNFGAGA